LASDLSSIFYKSGATVVVLYRWETFFGGKGKVYVTFLDRCSFCQD
jgi:hypothetical protein